MSAGRDAVRDQLAELAWGVLVAAGMRDGTRAPSPSVIAHAIVGNLLPVVDRIANGRAAAELRALAAKWDDESRDWYYDNRHTHDHGINYASGYEEGWDHAGQLACDRATELDPS